jgi:superfamily II DNA or RNA helicase
MIQVLLGSPTWYAESDLELVGAPAPPDDEAIRTGRFAQAADLRRRLTHIQLSGRLADLVYSMNTTNTDFYAHQYKPVLSFLESPSRGLLIADEVGLGKTIEAGLIWTELRARVDARRLLVICPKMLCDKWRLELRNRFGVEATIVDASELAGELKRPFLQYPASQAMIASMQSVRPPLDMDDITEAASPRRMLASVLRDAAGKDPLLDLVIIDEAHYLRNPETATHRLGRLLRDVSENIVLLTATPINLKNEDLFSLLNLVDPESFGYREQFQDVLIANEPLVRARLAVLNITKSSADVLNHLHAARGHEILRSSKQLQALIEDVQAAASRPLNESDRVRFADRIERVNSLSMVLTRTRKAEVTERKVVRMPHVQPVVMNPAERTFYELVTETVKQYALTNDISDGFLLASPQRQLSSCIYAAAGAWASQDDEEEVEESLYEDLGIDFAPKDISAFRRFLLDSIRGRFDLKALREHDSKFESLATSLRLFFADHPDEKVVLFSYFRGTLRYLENRLREIGLSSTVLMGGMKEDRTEIIAQFQTDPRLRILLSSEVASEGVDLQFSRFLVNYDLPWNPMKVEQRIGRIDRLGQKAETITILNLVYADTIDSRIIERLYARLNLFERALGGLEAVLGDEIQQLTAELLTGRLNPEQEEERINQSALALAKCNQAEQELEEQAGHLIAHSDFILKKVHAAREFSRQITNKDLMLYAKDYLEHHAQGHAWYQPSSDELQVDITLPALTRAKLDNYVIAKRLQGQTRLTEGGSRPCVFVNKVKSGGGPREQINQFHPLIRFISEEMLEDESALSVICVRLPFTAIPSGRLAPGAYAFCVQRWTFVGLRTEEAIRARAVPLAGRDHLSTEASVELLNAVRLDGKDWPGASSELDGRTAAKAIEDMEFELIDDFNSESKRKEAENADRIQFQLQSVRAYRDRKVATEKGRIITLGKEPRYRGLVIAAERTILSLVERFELQRAKLEQAANVSSRRDPVGRGIILVEGID